MPGGGGWLYLTGQLYEDKSLVLRAGMRGSRNFSPGGGGGVQVKLT